MRVTDGGKLLAFPQAPEAIEFRHLRSFVAVAEELNFGRAAERLYISQPALSRQIRSLEQLVGCELLRRSTHRVELTIAGEALLDRARPLLREVDEAVSATQSVGGELVARVAAPVGAGRRGGVDNADAAGDARCVRAAARSTSRCRRRWRSGRSTRTASPPCWSRPTGRAADAAAICTAAAT